MLAILTRLTFVSSKSSPAVAAIRVASTEDTRAAIKAVYTSTCISRSCNPTQWEATYNTRSTTTCYGQNEGTILFYITLRPHLQRKTSRDQSQFQGSYMIKSGFFTISQAINWLSTEKKRFSIFALAIFILTWRVNDFMCYISSGDLPSKLWKKRVLLFSNPVLMVNPQHKFVMNYHTMQWSP